MFCVRGCSSVVEHLIRNQEVLGSILDISIFSDNLCLTWIYGFVILKILVWSN